MKEIQIKEIYEEPKLEIIYLENSDILTLSIGDTSIHDIGEWDIES